VSKLSANQIYSLLLEGGFSPAHARTMTAIAQAESARNPTAIGDVALENHTWGPSVGLFQVRTLKGQTGTGGDRDIDHILHDPHAQVRAALHISNGGTNFHAWSTFTSGSYRQFLDEPLHVVPVDPADLAAAVGGGTTADDLHPPGDDPFAIDKGVQPSAVMDSDGDGLTDQFEAIFGTDAHAADSDHDGLSDAYETTISHTDPLSADTNHDGISDAEEIAEGKDPGHAAIPAAARAANFGGLDTVDSDGDGLSDGYEQSVSHTDPLVADSDHDSLPDGTEVADGSDPMSADTNHDGISDGFAAQQGLPIGQASALTSPLMSPLGGGLGGAGTDPAEDLAHLDPLADPTGDHFDDHLGDVATH
jgi:lysozyme-like protein/thrombospondin type 3 repeat protein